MPRYRLAPAAKQDLQDIFAYIAADSIRAADTMINRILDKLDLAAEYPMMGLSRPDIGLGTRVLVEGSYVIIYQPDDDGILVAAVVHAMTNPKRWLE